MSHHAIIDTNVDHQETFKTSHHSFTVAISNIAIDSLGNSLVIDGSELPQCPSSFAAFV
jgi:hypothetical protein